MIAIWDLRIRPLNPPILGDFDGLVPPDLGAGGRILIHLHKSCYIDVRPEQPSGQTVWDCCEKAQTSVLKPLSKGDRCILLHDIDRERIFLVNPLKVSLILLLQWRG